MNETQWLPGIIVLALGLVAGAIYLLLTRRRSAAASPTALHSQDVALRAQQLIDELKELEQNKHQLDADRYQSERTRLERAAADALRERDRAQAAPAPSARTPARAPARPATGFFARHPELKGAIWGGGLVVFFGALGAFLFLDEQARTEGGSMTGGPPQELQASAPPARDAEFERALDQARQFPNRVELVAAVVHELLRRQQFDQASLLTERTLSYDPFHVENRIHRAVLHAARGDAKTALSQLRHLADSYPDAQEALLFAGAIALDTNDRATAREAFEQYVAESRPEEVPPELFQALADLRGR